MGMPRFRRSRKSSIPRQVVQSYKKVLNFAPTSQTIGNHFNILATGVDSVAAGQTGVTDADVPTGCIIKYFEIQYSQSNLVLINAFTHFIIQRTHAGQTAIAGNIVGGNPQRNQVFYQSLAMLGQQQNMNRTFRFKVPKKYQRIREGDNWSFGYTTSAVVSDACQVIYKFYR